MVDCPAQAEVQAAADELVASRAEIGLQVAAIHEGRTVVDVVSGVSDTLTGAAVARDTLFSLGAHSEALATRRRPCCRSSRRPAPQGRGRACSRPPWPLTPRRRDPVLTMHLSTGEM